MTEARTRAAYDRAAATYDRDEAIEEFLLIRKLRKSLLRRASGKALEVAVGTGKNLPYYPEDCRISAVDSSAAMLDVARRRAGRVRRVADFHVMDAEELLFPDRAFDTVVSTLSLCTFSHPASALREMRRVCRAEGRILLLEHGRSAWGWLARWQDKYADAHARILGCRWNLDPLEIVRRTGLRLLSSERFAGGVFHSIEAAP